MKTMPSRRDSKSCETLKLSWAGILLFTNFLSLHLPVPLLSQLWIHSQAASVYAVCCSENANTFSIMNIWETPVEKSSDSIPSMLLAVTAEKQAADGIRKCGGKKGRMCTWLLFQDPESCHAVLQPLSKSTLVWLVAFLIFEMYLSFYSLWCYIRKNFWYKLHLEILI